MSKAISKPSFMVRLGQFIAAKAIVLFSVLALLLIPYAHPSTDATTANPEFVAFLAVGGTLDDLCLTSDSHDPGQGHTECPACALGKSLLLASVLPGDAGDATAIDLCLRLTDTVARSGHSPRGPPARGPPTATLI